MAALLLRRAVRSSAPLAPPPPPPLPALSPAPSPAAALARPPSRLARPCFAPSPAAARPDGPDTGGPDPNKAKLGRTLRILQDRMPTLLQSPLPQDVLAPGIKLRLFPTTHPHLPTVSGRVAYNAALWTSPIAWNRVPIIGNVRLEILAERVTSEPLALVPQSPGAMAEQLVVRWCEKRRPAGGGVGRALWRPRAGADPNKAFTGLFVFDFDADGRVLTHTIEQVQEGGDWERGMGAKFVGLTDWLLGGMKSPGEAPIPHA